MKVSVIVPVYNVEPYLRKCLDSLVNQTLQELEILVVNDGSPDGCQAIIDEYAAKYPGKVLGFQKENGGQASARNLALGHTRGEYVGFVDSDDWVDERMYETMYQKAVDTGADIVICNTIDHNPGQDVYHRQSDVGKFRKCGSVCNKLFRASLIGGAKFPVGKWYEDFCFGIQLLLQTEKVEYCQEHFYHALTRPVSTMTNNNSLKNLDMLDVMAQVEAFARDHGYMDGFGYDLEYMMIEHILITSINRVAQQKTKERSQVIGKLRRFVLERYPRFWKDPAFREFGSSQKIVALCNAYGLWGVSQALFGLKRMLKKG